MTCLTVEEWERGIKQLLDIETYVENMLLDLPMTEVWKIVKDKPLGDSKQEVGCDANPM